ncbi:hypothetical protein SCLCIDRAFT_129288, partial [Scleroderma citrinum Foug A]
YICGWVTSDMICGIPIVGELFSVHLRDHHHVVGDDKAKVRCDWSKCGMVMNKESIVRHVAEMHLHYKFCCDECNATFTRRHTLNSHVRKEH